jgi:predicted NBD/HSP70 family sugar kinase
MLEDIENEKEKPMVEIGSNMKSVKITNRAAMLKIIYNKGKSSQKNLSKELNLTQGAVSLICNEMMESGILSVTGETIGEYQVGRKQVLVEVNYNYKYVIGVDISEGIAMITLTNLNAEIIEKRSLEFNINENPNSLLKEIASEIIKLLWKNNISKESIVGVGITIVGVVDNLAGISLNDYKIWRKPVQIKEILEDELNLKVFVENNVCAFAIGETLFSGVGSCDNSLFLKWGPGVGSAIILNGVIYKAKNHSSAELGHTIVDLNGELCTCGNRGCVESFVSLASISKGLKNMAQDGNSEELIKKLEKYNNKIDSNNVVELLLVKDEKVEEYREHLVSVLAFATYNSSKIISPERVIIYGYMFESDEIVNDFINVYKKIDNSETEIEFARSNYISKHNYIGAIAIAVRKGFLDIGGFYSKL